MKNKHVGLLIVGVSLLIGFLIWLFNKTLTEMVNSSCSHGPTCPMWGSIKFQTSVGISILVFVFIIGLYFIFFAKDMPLLKEIHKLKIIREGKGNASSMIDAKKKESMLKSLSEDERKIYYIIDGADGSIFQSQLVKDTGYSKVKVTRILDRLEGKGLIDRKRRGMTNIVMLKH